MKIRYLPHCMLVLGIAVSAHAATSAGGGKPAKSDQAGVQATTPSKNALTQDTMVALHQLIRLQPGEFRWDEIPWYTSIWHARQVAAAADKPILVFGTGGAGFNDPLGNC